MSRRICVTAGPRREIAVVEDGRLAEYLREEAEPTATEAICLGRVVRVMTGMQAAFVDIGREKNGFLPLTEKSQSFQGTRLSDGMAVAVQIKKAAHDGKGAFLSRDITLCGQTVLLMPCNRFIGVSNRVPDADRSALKELGQRVADGRFGLVLRNAALDAEADAIREEAEELFAQWQALARRIPTAHAPSVLYQPRTLLESVLDDYLPRGVEEIITDDPTLTVAEVPVRVTEPGLMEREGLTRQRDKALQRRVWLDCGGNLVIDPCEAMTVIDVNTAKNTGRRQLEDTLLRTDLEAAREVARQIRLRNLSGIILVDMIDLTDPEHRERVLAALREALAEDRVKTVVHGMTGLGLIEITRKKSRLPLRDEWMVPCPHCGGTGFINKEETHG